MQPRKVIIQLEVFTDARFKDLERVLRSKTIVEEITFCCGYKTTTFDVVKKPRVNVVKK